MTGDEISVSTPPRDVNPRQIRLRHADILHEIRADISDHRKRSKHQHDDQREGGEVVGMGGGLPDLVERLDARPIGVEVPSEGRQRPDGIREDDRAKPGEQEERGLPAVTNPDGETERNAED
jgi:hypothetical protein